MPLQIIPSIDLRKGAVVRLVQGDFDRQIDYDADAIDVARGFASAGATLMHVVDLDGAKDGSARQTPLVRQIVENAGIDVQVGGGVRSDDDVRALLDVGVARVVVGTRAVEDWAWFDRLARGSGLADRLVLAVDGNAGRVMTRGWRHDAGVTAVELTQRCEDWGVGAILYTEVARDGMMNGVGLEHTLALADATKTPVLASGGIGNLGHLEPLQGTRIAGVILGRSLREGKVSLADAIRWASAD